MIKNKKNIFKNEVILSHPLVAKLSKSFPDLGLGLPCYILHSVFKEIHPFDKGMSLVYILKYDTVIQKKYILKNEVILLHPLVGK